MTPHFIPCRPPRVPQGSPGDGLGHRRLPAAPGFAAGERTATGFRRGSSPEPAGPQRVRAAISPAARRGYDSVLSLAARCRIRHGSRGGYLREALETPLKEKVDGVVMICEERPFSDDHHVTVTSTRTISAGLAKDGRSQPASGESRP